MKVKYGKNGYQIHIDRIGNCHVMINRLQLGISCLYKLSHCPYIIFHIPKLSFGFQYYKKNLWQFIVSTNSSRYYLGTNGYESDKYEDCELQ